MKKQPVQRSVDDAGSSRPSVDPSTARNLLRELEEAHRKQKNISELTDVEWDIRRGEWEKERLSWIQQMEENSIWAMGSSPYAVRKRPTGGGPTPSVRFANNDQVDITNVSLTREDLALLMTPRHMFGLDPNLLHGIQSDKNMHLGESSKYKGLPPSIKSFQPDPAGAPGAVVPGEKQASKQPTSRTDTAAPLSTVLPKSKTKGTPKMKRMSRLEVLKFIANWDKSSFGKRDLMIIDFIKGYKTRENIYDSDQLFNCGGSLLFCRFVISMQMSFLKHRRVWHYFDGLAIFVRSLQGDRYSEEFLRLGGLGFICEVIRVQGSEGEADKLHACKFLVHLMRGRKSIAVKMFICDNPHFLESLIDSLTMCRDKKLVTYCGLCFEHLCLEATMPQILNVTSYVTRLLPCDFNPIIQSMAFRVLQSVIRLKPSISQRCVKPLLDNLKTEDMDLLVEMSNIALVILQTRAGTELINQLMFVAEGIHLREQFMTQFRPHMRRTQRGQHTKDQALELRKAREKHERVRQKMAKFDHYMQQAGALFLLNRMMTDKVDFVAEFTRQGICGLSLKTLGSCPHWEVQGQGVTMVQFLHAMSIECAISYSLMLPPKMLKLILHRPAECLRYFTSPICVLLRKLGRFALRLWGRWVEKVIVPAKAVAEGGVLPDYFIGMCKMTRKVNEIQMAIQDLLENPVMESYSKSTDPTSQADATITITDRRTTPVTSREPTEAEILKEFVTDDEDEHDVKRYRTGKELLFEGRQFTPFAPFLEFQSQMSEDKLDIKVNKSQQSMLLPDKNKDTELSAYEQALLQDAEAKDGHTGKLGDVGTAARGGGLGDQVVSSNSGDSLGGGNKDRASKMDVDDSGGDN